MFPREFPPLPTSAEWKLFYNENSREQIDLVVDIRRILPRTELIKENRLEALLDCGTVIIKGTEKIREILRL